MAAAGSEAAYLPVQPAVVPEPQLDGDSLAQPRRPDEADGDGVLHAVVEQHLDRECVAVVGDRDVHALEDGHHPVDHLRDMLLGLRGVRALLVEGRLFHFHVASGQGHEGDGTKQGGEWLKLHLREGVLQSDLSQRKRHGHPKYPDSPRNFFETGGNGNGKREPARASKCAHVEASD